MGGAALATAIDVDAIFYNQAGLAKSKGDSISLSANLYGLERYETKGGLDWGEDAESSSFVSIPAAMGGVKRFSDEWVGGFGVDVDFGSGDDLNYDNQGNKTRVDSDRLVVLATVSTTYYF